MWGSGVWFGEKKDSFGEVEIAQDVPTLYRESNLGSNAGKMRRPVGWREKRDVMVSLAGGQHPNYKGGKITPFFVRGKQDDHSTLGRPDLHQNTRMKSQLLSEIFRPAGTKPHITH